MHEAVIENGTAGEKVIAIYVAVAFQPGRGRIVDAAGLEFEKRMGDAFVILVADVELVIDAIDVI